LVWFKKNAGISRATAYRYIGVAGRMSLKECKDVPLNDIYFVIGEQKQSEQNTLSTAKSSHVENKKEPVQSSHIAEDAGQPKSSHAETNEKLPLPKNDEPDLSWQVEDDVDDADAEFVQAIDAFAGVLGAFLDEGTANFLKPVEKRRIADRLIVAEKLVLQVKKAVLPKAKRRAA
jgi:hypothetical protein